MRFHLRRRINLGLIRLNLTERGFSSWSIHPFPRVSWNSRTRRWTIDTPGPGYLRTKPRRRRRR